MKNFCFLFFVFFTIISFGQNNNNTIGFIENKGQIVDQKGKPNPLVHYLLNTNGLNVQLRNNGFSYDIYETEKVPLRKKDKTLLHSDFDKDVKIQDSTIKYKYHRIDIDFLNSDADVKLLAEEKSVDYDNYYNVASAPQGITDVHKYKKVTYQNIYNQIDVVFFIPKDASKAVEYNFVVRPGGKASDIQLQFKGAKTELESNKIKMDVRFGQMEETLPSSWEENGGGRKELAIGYKKIKKNVYGFDGELDASNKTIVIDPTPVRLWGTFYGDETNGGYPYFGDICTDKLGNIYFVGYSGSRISSYATSGTHQSSTTNPGSVDGIIAKFDLTGNRLWGTFYGGEDVDQIFGVKTDSQNNIVVTGSTYSAGNISTNNSRNGFEDAFIAKLTPAGIRMWGTYFGGSVGEISYDVDVDNNNNIYIVGTTRSYEGISINNNFQTLLNQSGAIPNSSFDGFLSKFDSNGNLIWSTYVGGELSDELRVIKVTANSILVGGDTFSLNYISTSGVFQENNYGPLYGLDGMVYKFTLNGSRLWSTYYGGESVEKIRAIEVDDEDNIYLGGETLSSNNVATPGSFDNYNLNAETGFLAKLNTNNGQRIWGTYIGNTAKLYSIKYNNNNIYIGGTGGSDSSITTPCSYKRDGLAEGYLGKFSKNGNLLLGTYVGGFDQYSNTKICFDINNDIIMGGTTHQDDGIADSNSYQSTILGPKNFYLMKFSESANCNINLTPTSDSPVCIGSNLNFNVQSGYHYVWTGPSGFSSNSQNPTINNVSSTNSGTYTLVASDNCGCSKTYYLNVIIQDLTAPLPDTATLPIITGDCNTTISTIPAATDTCTGLITGTTTDPLSYTIPGTYTIHWNYDDGNGNIATQNQTVIVAATTAPIVNASFYYCVGQTPTLADITITGQNIQWYDVLTNGNLLINSTVLQNGITYYASQTINSCESLRVPVTVNIQNTSAPTGDQNQSFCATQNPILTDVIITGTGINWYSSTVSTTALSPTTTLVNGTTYYAAQTINGCESINRLPVTVTLINTLNATDYSETLCDDLNDGNETLNLTNYNPDLISNTSGCTFEYYNSFLGATNQSSNDRITNPAAYSLGLGLKTIYVRITSSNGCHQIVELQLTLVSKPFIPISDIMPICEGSSITVDAGLGYDGYLWSTNETTSSIVISTPGNYSVTVDENHGTLKCTSIKNFSVVKSNVATISQVITSDWTDNENTITVMLTESSVGDYVYSLDGITYQSSNTFSGLGSGEYTVYVKDKNGCGITSDDFYLLMYPKFFTPNGDGFHDTWQIKFSKNESNLVVKLFDRFGKLLKVLDNNKGWNGTLNNMELPATDYWFVVTRANGKEYKGHFALKR